MIKLRKVNTDKGFILEEIETDKVNKKLIDAGANKGLDLPHVENNPESVQAHIDAVKKEVEKENKELEKVAEETKTEDKVVFAESKKFNSRKDLSPFLEQLKEQQIKHRVVPLHEDAEGYRFEVKFEKPLVEQQLKESYETAFEVCKDGSKVMAVGSFKDTRMYRHELVDFECCKGKGHGDYRWMNRPWERFTFAQALQEAMISAGIDSAFAKKCIDNSGSLRDAIKYFADNFACEEPEVKENLKEDKEEWEDDFDLTAEDAYEHIQYEMSDEERKELFKKHNGKYPKDMDEFWDWVEEVCPIDESLKEGKRLSDKEIYDILGIEEDNYADYKYLLPQFRELYKKHGDEVSIWLKGDAGISFRKDAIIDSTKDLVAVKDEDASYEVESLKEDKDEVVTTKEIECAGGFDKEEDLENYPEIELVSQRDEGNFSYVVLRGPKSSIKDLFTEENDYTDDDLFESLKEETEEPKLETYEEQIDFLVKDEDEAIAGYDKILALVEDENVKEQLQHLKEEEVAHKEFLEILKKDPFAKYEHKDEEEPKEDEPEEDDDDISAFKLPAEDEVHVDVGEINWDSLDEDLDDDNEGTTNTFDDLDEAPINDEVKHAPTETQTQINEDVEDDDVDVPTVDATNKAGDMWDFGDEE